MHNDSRRLLTLLLSLAMALTLAAPGLAAQEPPDASPASAATSSVAEPEHSDAADPSQPEQDAEQPDAADASQSEQDAEQPDAADASQPEQDAEQSDAADPSQPEQDTEQSEASDASLAEESDPGEAAASSVQPEQADDSAALAPVSEEEAASDPAELWWRTGPDSFAPKVDFAYSGKPRRPLYLLMKDGVEQPRAKSWTEAWYADEDCTVPATDFVNCGTLTLRLMDGTQVMAQGSFRIVKAEQRITVRCGGLEKPFKSKSRFQLNAKSSGDGRLRYESSDPKVLKVNSKGKCTMLGQGKVTVTVTAAETEHHRAAVGRVELTLYKKAKKLSYSKSYKKSKYYKALKALKLTGSDRENIADIALSQLGYHEGRRSGELGGSGRGRNMSNWTEYGRYYGLNHQPWCAMFVHWCAREAGVSRSVIPKECAVRYYHRYFRSKGRFHSWSKVRSGSYQPKKGDIILYAYSKGGTAHHIGFVLDVSYEGGRVKLNTVEGNTNDKVKLVSMDFSSKSAGRHDGHYILGIASPKY